VEQQLRTSDAAAGRGAGLVGVSDGWALGHTPRKIKTKAGARPSLPHAAATATSACRDRAVAAVRPIGHPIACAQSERPSWAASAGASNAGPRCASLHGGGCRGAARAASHRPMLPLTWAQAALGLDGPARDRRDEVCPTRPGLGPRGRQSARALAHGQDGLYDRAAQRHPIPTLRDGSLTRGCAPPKILQRGFWLHGWQHAAARQERGLGRGSDSTVREPGQRAQPSCIDGEPCAAH